MLLSQCSSRFRLQLYEVACYSHHSIKYKIMSGFSKINSYIGLDYLDAHINPRQEYQSHYVCLLIQVRVLLVHTVSKLDKLLLHTNENGINHGNVRLYDTMMEYFFQPNYKIDRQTELQGQGQQKLKRRSVIFHTQLWNFWVLLRYNRKILGSTRYGYV